MRLTHSAGLVALLVALLSWLPAAGQEREDSDKFVYTYYVMGKTKADPVERKLSLAYKTKPEAEKDQKEREFDYHNKNGLLYGTPEEDKPIEMRVATFRAPKDSPSDEREVLPDPAPKVGKKIEIKGIDFIDVPPTEDRLRDLYTRALDAIKHFNKAGAAATKQQADAANYLIDKFNKAFAEFTKKNKAPKEMATLQRVAIGPKNTPKAPADKFAEELIGSWKQVKGIDPQSLIEATYTFSKDGTGVADTVWNAAMQGTQRRTNKLSWKYENSKLTIKQLDTSNNNEWTWTKEQFHEIFKKAK